MPNESEETNDKMYTCGTCHGAGAVSSDYRPAVGMWDCPTCNGYGFVRDRDWALDPTEHDDTSNETAGDVPDSESD
jgi:DnaJ-class molecular chaperone